MEKEREREKGERSERREREGREREREEREPIEQLKSILSPHLFLTHSLSYPLSNEKCSTHTTNEKEREIERESYLPHPSRLSFFPFLFFSP